MWKEYDLLKAFKMEVGDFYVIISHWPYSPWNGWIQFS